MRTIYLFLLAFLPVPVSYTHLFRYSASVQYNDILGVMKGSDRKTFNGNINLMYQQEKLLFRNNLEVGLSESNESPYGSFDQYVKLNPYWRERGEDGKVLKELEQKGDFWTCLLYTSTGLVTATLKAADTFQPGVKIMKLAGRMNFSVE